MRALVVGSRLAASGISWRYFAYQTGPRVTGAVRVRN
jgi:hypothetical protein